MRKLLSVLSKREQGPELEHLAMETERRINGFRNRHHELLQPKSWAVFLPSRPRSAWH